jgi:hypothetical protein
MGIPTSRDPDTPEGLDRTRARKNPLNQNGFRQSFRARATLRTLDKPGCPPALRTSPLSLLYKE